MQHSLFDLPRKKKSPAKAIAEAELTIGTKIEQPAEEDINTSEKILGVSDFLEYINQVLKIAADIKVVGEISRLSHHPTGVYMTLKDKSEEGVLDCYINPYTYRGLGLTLEEGMEVKITGLPGIFKRRSQLSFRVESVELAGEGTLKKAYELLKQKLEQEGLFDRKRELPEFISSIGVITSKTGAVIDDFRHNLELLGCRMYFKDCRVEGKQAANQIVNALRYFNIKHPELDCLVVMRGGGSLEDLQAFNSESLVKELFASRIPVIAAIGHDRDVPLACLVADRYTSTPTAAAMLINGSWVRLRTDLPRLESMIVHGFELGLEDKRAQLGNLTQQLTGSFNQVFQRYRHLSEQILRGMAQIQNTIHARKERAQTLLMKIYGDLSRSLQAQLDVVSNSEKLLAAADPERNLKLGYSLAYTKEGKLLRSDTQVRVGDKVNLKLHSGQINTQVINNN